MTPTQEKVLRYYLKAFEKNGRCPTMREATKHLDCTPQAVYAILRALVAAGHLVHQKAEDRSSYSPGSKAGEP